MNRLYVCLGELASQPLLLVAESDDLALLREAQQDLILDWYEQLDVNGEGCRRAELRFVFIHTGSGRRC